MKKDDIVYYVDRLTGQKKIEQVVGAKLVHFFSQPGWRRKCVEFACRYSIFSFLYGLWQKMPWTKKNILSFALRFGIKLEECEKSIDEFTSVNDFFTRTLRPESRPIVQDKNVCIIPADARYSVCPVIRASKMFFIKGQEFFLGAFLENDKLAERYDGGSLVVARLAPVDYHRFHFPCDCIPDKPRVINGKLLSVHPLSLNIRSYFSENKRIVTKLKTETFGDVLFVEIGALNVGSIKQTFIPGQFYKKGEEKGYFALGASAIAMVFEKDRIIFDEDLTFFSKIEVEALCFFGQSLGCSDKTL
ncbi:MAG: archaetidylserine decarboxylase [Victivallaceae bacterium]